MFDFANRASDGYNSQVSDEVTVGVPAESGEDRLEDDADSSE